MAEFEGSIINVIFESSKGELSIQSQEATVGKPYGMLPRPVREGFVFDGWFTEPEGKGGTKVTSTDIVTSDSDIRLYAHWIRKSKKGKKATMLKKQVVALCLIIAGVILLSVAIPLIRYFVLESFTYTETDPTGQKQKYVIRKKDGVYVMMHQDGSVLYVNDDGYYTTDAGTLIQLDASTGSYEIYAVVDTEGSEVVGVNKRLLIFPQLTQGTTSGNEDTIIGRIEVHNTYGSYTVYRNAGEVRFTLEGFEEQPMVTIDQTLIAYLCVATGYTLSMQKLNTAQVLENGYEEYGFRMEDDGNGSQKAVSDNWYTIFSRSGKYAYTVYIGDPLVSDGGYYVKLEGRDAIYVLSNTMSSTLLAPVEAMVTPMIVYPMQLTTYFNVEDFAIFTLDYHTDESGNYVQNEEGSYEYDLDLDIAFTFYSLESRQNTMRSIHSFDFSKKYKSKLRDIFACEGYEINSDNCSATMQKFYSMKFVRCAHLGLDTLTTAEDLAEFGLDKAERIITFTYNLDSDSDGTFDSSLDYILWISPMTEQGTYYILSDFTDMIVEVEKSYLDFLEWEDVVWLNKSYFQINLAFCKDLEITNFETTHFFELDNSATDQSKTVGSSDVRIWADGEELTYSIPTKTATGRDKMVSGVDNFRDFYQSLLTASIEGVADLTEEQKQAYRDAGDEGAQLKIIVHAEDEATLRNPEYWTENNKKDMVIRFYQYSERRSFMTINGQGEFYVLSSFVEKLMADADRVLNQELIEATSKY